MRYCVQQFYSMCLHSCNILCNTMCNFWWTATKLLCDHVYIINLYVANGGYTKKFVAYNVAEVGRNSTVAILHAITSLVDTQCHLAIALNVALCIRSLSGQRSHEERGVKQNPRGEGQLGKSQEQITITISGLLSPYCKLQIHIFSCHFACMLCAWAINWWGKNLVSL